MIPAHAPTVDVRDRTPPPSGRRGNGNSPETPTPACEQSATFPFEVALRFFQSRHGHRAHRERDALFEHAMRIDMRSESVLPCSEGQVSAHRLEFLTWAIQLRRAPAWRAVVERFGVSRATAYRWLDLMQRSKEKP